MPYARKGAPPRATTTPDLIGVLAGALSHTGRELSDLEGRVERAQHAARALIALAPRTDSGRRAAGELKRALDDLVEWQISDQRRVGSHRRAYARAKLEAIANA